MSKFYIRRSNTPPGNERDINMILVFKLMGLNHEFSERTKFNFKETMNEYGLIIC